MEDDGKINFTPAKAQPADMSDEDPAPESDKGS